MPTSTVTVSSTIDSHMRSADSAAARRTTSSIGFSSGETFPADADVNEGDEHLTPSDGKRYKYRDSAWSIISEGSASSVSTAPLEVDMANSYPLRLRRDLALSEPDAAPIIIAGYKLGYDWADATRTAASNLATASGGAAGIVAAHPRALDAAAAVLAKGGSMTVAGLAALSTFFSYEFDFARREIGTRLWLGTFGVSGILDILHPAKYRSWDPSAPANEVSVVGTVNASGTAGHVVSDGSTGYINMGSGSMEFAEPSDFAMAWYGATARVSTAGANIMVGHSTGRTFAGSDGDVALEYYKFSPAAASGTWRTNSVGVGVTQGLIFTYWDGTTATIHQKKSAGGSDLTVQAATVSAPSLTLTGLTAMAYGGVSMHLTPMALCYTGPLPTGVTRANFASYLFNLVTSCGAASV